MSGVEAAAHLRFLPLPVQTSKFTFFKPFYFHQSLAPPFRCLCFVISTEGACPAIDVAAPNQSNPVVELFYCYGFSEDQVERILSKSRKLGAADPDKTIRPKLDCLLSFGYSQFELVTLISSDPHLLTVSLERIVHRISLLEQLLGSQELVKKAISRSSRLLRYNWDNFVVPNVKILRIHGVPDKRIVQVVTTFPRVIIQKPDVTNTIAMEVRNLGIDPSSRAFIVALNAKIALTQHVWDSREALYKSFGWSEQDFLSAFKKRPYCMLNSEEKIKKMMNFYVEKLGWDPVFLSEKPLLIDLSLEKRVLPWCSVLNVLASMELLGGEVSLPNLLLMTQKSFEVNYVVKYMDISVVRKAYEGMIEEDFKALRAWEKRNIERKNEEC